MVVWPQLPQTIRDHKYFNAVSYKDLTPCLMGLQAYVPQYPSGLLKVGEMKGR